MSESKKYNYCLDFVKGIACVFVVLMHVEFPGNLGIAVQAISRFCVPFFFMVSGYFCYKPVSEISNRKLSKKILHIFKIVVYASLFYLLYLVLQQLIWHDINWSVNLGQIRSFVLLNQPFIIAGQYWFLFALLYTYIMYAVLEHFGMRRAEYYIGGAMIIVYILLAQGLHIAGIKVPSPVYRNFLVEGFAFFMMGHWIKEHQASLNFSNKTLLWVIAISTVASLGERCLLGRDFGVNICTFPQVFALFVYAVNNPGKHAGLLQTIGKRYSMFVYIIHPMVWHLLDRAYAALDLSYNAPAMYLRPLLVVLLTLLFSHLVYSFNEWTARKKTANA